jgi:hypothetical protein
VGFLYPPLVRWERDQVLVCTLADAETMVVTRCFIGLSLPHPPKPPSQTDAHTDKAINILDFESYKNMLSILGFSFLYLKIFHAHYTPFTCDNGLLKI